MEPTNVPHPPLPPVEHTRHAVPTSFSNGRAVLSVTIPATTPSNTSSMVSTPTSLTPSACIGQLRVVGNGDTSASVSDADDSELTGTKAFGRRKYKRCHQQHQLASSDRSDVRTAPTSPTQIQILPKPPATSRARSEAPSQNAFSLSMHLYPPSATMCSPRLPCAVAPGCSLLSFGGGSGSGSTVASPRSKNASVVSPINNIVSLHHNGASSSSSLLVADAQIIRLLRWLSRCCGRLGDIACGMVAPETVRLEALANSGKHGSIFHPLPSHGPSLEPINPGASTRRFSRSNSAALSECSMSRSSSVAATTMDRSHEQQPAGATGHTRASSSKRCSTLDIHVITSIVHQVLSVNQQLLEEARFLGAKPFALSSDDARLAFTQLLETLLIEWFPLMGSEWGCSTLAMTEQAGHLLSMVQECECIFRQVWVLLERACTFEWVTPKRQLLQWIVKLIGRGSLVPLQLLLSSQSVVDTLSAKDAKFLISCVVSSIDFDYGDAVGTLVVLIQTLPLCFQVRQADDALNIVWHEAVAHIIRLRKSTTPRVQLVNALRQDAKSEQRLLEVNFDSQEANDKQTIFSRACREGDAELVELLLDAREHLGQGLTVVSRCQSDGTNALQQATARGHLSIVELLCSLPDDLILPAFTSVVKGKGDVFEIASALHHDAIAAVLTQRAPWLCKPMATDMSEATAAFVPREPPDGPIDTLAGISVVDDEFPTIGMTIGEKPSTPMEDDLLSPSAILLPPDVLANMSPLASYQLGSSMLSRILCSSSRTAEAVEALTHDEAAAIRSLFESRPVQQQPPERSDEGTQQAELDKLIDPLVRLVRQTMRKYLGLRSPPPTEGGHDIDSCPQQYVTAALQQGAGVDVDEVVQALMDRSRFGSRRKLDPSAFAPANVSLAAIFGLPVDGTPMPSRVERLLLCVKPALSLSSSGVNLAIIAVADDWLVGSLRIDGMFDAVVRSCFSQEDLAAPSVKQLVEHHIDRPSLVFYRVVSAMTMFVGRLLSLSRVSPSSSSSNAPPHERSSLPQECIHMSAGGCKDHILKLQDVIRCRAGQDAHTTAVLLASRHAALSFVSILSANRHVLLHVTPEVPGIIEGNPTADAVWPSGSSSSYDLQRSVHSAFDSLSSGQCTPTIRDRYVGPHAETGSAATEQFVMLHFGCLPAAILLWVGSQTFSEVDDPGFLLSTNRRQTLSWILKVLRPSKDALSLVNTTSFHASISSSANELYSPNEQMLYFSSTPDAVRAFSSEINHANIESMLLRPLFARAIACGDSTVMQLLYTTVGSDGNASPLDVGAPFGWGETMCGLTPLMLGILGGQRSTVEYLVAAAVASHAAHLLVQPSGRIGFNAHSAEESVHLEASATTGTSMKMVDALWVCRCVNDAYTTGLLLEAEEARRLVSNHGAS